MQVFLVCTNRYAPEYFKSRNDVLYLDISNIKPILANSERTKQFSSLWLILHVWCVQFANLRPIRQRVDSLTHTPFFMYLKTVGTMGFFDRSSHSKSRVTNKHLYIYLCSKLALYDFDNHSPTWPLMVWPLIDLGRMFSTK